MPTERTDNIKLPVIKDWLIQAVKDRANLKLKYLKKYPFAKNWTLENLQQFEKNAKPMVVNGKVVTPTSYKSPLIKESKGLNKQALEAAKQLLELKLIDQASEIINHPDNPIGWIPGVRTLFNIGADLRYRRLTGYSSYTTNAALSAATDATMLRFLPVKSYVGSYAGSVAGGMIGNLFNSPNLGRFVGGLVGGFTPIKFGHKPLQLTYDDVRDYTPELWDAAYNEALRLKDMKLIQKLRDWHYIYSVPNSKLTVLSSDTPVTYYHGTKYGGHAIFNSKVSNATIGGESAAGNIKGNFLTTNKDAASHYAHGNKIVNPKFMHTYDNKYVIDLMSIEDPLKKKLRELYIHLMNLHVNRKKKQKFLASHKITPDDIFEKSILLKNVIYPFYVNPGNKVKNVDFAGLGWNKSPVIAPSFYVKERLPIWYPISMIDGSYKYSNSDGIRISAIFNNKNDAITFMQNRLGSRTKPTTQMHDDKFNKADIAYTLPGKLRNRSFIGIFENHYPRTTNGVVQKAWDDRYTSVTIDNVLDDTVDPINELITFNSNLMKLANPITYDNKGNIIPLSKRDNWLLPDVRYSWLLVPSLISNNE